MGFVGLICVFLRWWLWVTFLTGLWSRWWRGMMRIIPRSWETRLPSWRTRWRDSTTCASWAGAAEVPHLSICFLSVSLWSDACVCWKCNNIFILYYDKKGIIYFFFMQAQFEMSKLSCNSTWTHKLQYCTVETGKKWAHITACFNYLSQRNNFPTAEFFLKDLRFKKTFLFTHLKTPYLLHSSHSFTSFSFSSFSFWPRSSHSHFSCKCYTLNSCRRMSGKRGSVWIKSTFHFCSQLPHPHSPHTSLGFLPLKAQLHCI